MRRVLVLFALACALPARAQTRALLITDPSRAEPLMAAGELVPLIEAQGLSADIDVPVSPGDLEPYACVFDLRYGPPIDAAQSSAWAAHLARGRGLHLTGEHSFFAARNDSVAAFIAAMGGGPVAVSHVPLGPPIPDETVEALEPSGVLAQGCRLVDEVAYVDPGEFLDIGSGARASGSAMATWSDGALAVAPASRLVVALDINWLMTGSAGTLDAHVVAPMGPTQNRALAADMVRWLCAPGSACGPCEPRTHGAWQRACLGWEEPHPGPSPQTAAFDASLQDRVDAELSPSGVRACEAIDDGPFSDPRRAALRELATLRLNLAAGLLMPGCAVELEPVMPGSTVAAAVIEMERLLSLGDDGSAKTARWIGEHVNAGEALAP